MKDEKLVEKMMSQGWDAVISDVAMLDAARQRELLQTLVVLFKAWPMPLSAYATSLVSCIKGLACLLPHDAAWHKRFIEGEQAFCRTDLIERVPCYWVMNEFGRDGAGSVERERLIVIHACLIEHYLKEHDAALAMPREEGRDEPRHDPEHEHGYTG